MIRFVFVCFSMCLCFGCGDSPEKSPAQLGRIVESLPNIQGAEEPYKFPEIEGHADCKVTGDRVDDFF